MTVEITATISINKDGTWDILNFGNTKQKTIDSFWTDTSEERKAKKKVKVLGELTDEEHERRGAILNQQMSESQGSEFKPASWYLDNAKKTRNRRKYNRGPNHCGRCGMVNKNKLTCLSVMRADGTFESQKHREAEYPFGRWI